MNRHCFWLILALPFLILGCATEEPAVPRISNLNMESFTNTIIVPPRPLVEFRRSSANRRRPPTEFSGPLAKYDARFTETINRNWKGQMFSEPEVKQKGSVIIRFRLYPNGKVRELTVEKSDVDQRATGYCLRAISQGAPYERFAFPYNGPTSTPEYRDVRFTFNYD